MSAAVAGRAGGSETRRAILAASGQRVVQQQRRRLHFRVALQFAAAHPAAAGAGRQRLLRRWLAFALGKPAPALHRGLGAALQIADHPAQGNDLARERSAGHRSGGDDLPRGALEPDAPAHFDPAPARGENAHWRSDAAGVPWLLLPATADQPYPRASRPLPSGAITTV